MLLVRWNVCRQYRTRRFPARLRGQCIIWEYPSHAQQQRSSKNNQVPYTLYSHFLISPHRISHTRHIQKELLLLNSPQRSSKRGESWLSFQWIKTYPGTGHVKNVTFRNIEFTDVNQPIYLTTCIYSSQNCDSSRIQISDIRWENIHGTARYNVGAGMHCSTAAPCQNLSFSDIDITQNGGGAVKYLCSNIQNQKTMG
jgi:Glycosyl hydrolases family 28